VKCFTSILDAGTMLNGFFREGMVFINATSPARLWPERKARHYHIDW